MFRLPPTRLTLTLAFILLVLTMSIASGQPLNGPGEYRITAPDGVVRIPFAPVEEPGLLDQEDAKVSTNKCDRSPRN